MSHKKARKAPVYHAPLSEHFHGSFPLFINRFNEGFELREHDHEYLEMVYVMAGEGFHYIGSHVDRVSKGQLYILPVGTSHVLRPSDAAGTKAPVVYNLCIRPDFIVELKGWLSRYGGEDALWSVLEIEAGHYLKLNDEGLRLGRVFEQLHLEYAESKRGYEASMFSLLIQLIVQLARMLDRQADARPRTSAAVKVRMSEILEYIHDHITEPLTLEQIAVRAGLSRRHMIRRFQECTGMDFSDYVQHRRIELACRLLLETDQKIEAIAKSVGYRDTSHFRQVFRSLVGLSPREYRKQGGIAEPQRAP